MAKSQQQQPLQAASSSNTPKNPYGFSAGLALNQSTTNQADTKLKLKRDWDIALAPLKSIPMNAFIMYMAGNTIHTFSILITTMLVYNNLKAIFSVSKVFENSGNTLIRVVYVLTHALVLAIGLYKFSSMGLLPTSSSDWLAFLSPKQVCFGSVV